MFVLQLLVSAFCMIWTHPVQAQYFYSAPQLQPFPQDFHRSFLPQVIPPPNFYNFPARTVINFPQNPAVTSYYNAPPPPPQGAEFRGFGYHTDYQDGATSTVYFLTGPQSANFRNFQDFPSFIKKAQETPVEKSMSLASDILDANAVPDVPREIQKILQPEDFEKLFTNNINGVTNFYTYPADTVPLVKNSFDTFRNTNNNNVSEINVTTETPSITTTKPTESEAAESILRASFSTNDLKIEAKLAESSSEPTTTTIASIITTTISDTSPSSTAVLTESSTEVETEQPNENLTETTTIGSTDTTTLESHNLEQ